MTDRSAPVISIQIYEPGKNGKRADVSEMITDLSYEDTELAADRVELSVNNFDLSLFDDPLWKTGNRMQLTWGYAGDTVPAREAIITSIKGSLILKITALAKSILMNKKPISKVFNQTRISDVAKLIAEANGYGPDQQFIEDTNVVLPHIVQARLTDAQFLKSLAAREGYQFFVDFDGFHFHRRKMGKAPIRTFIYYTDPGQGDVITFNVENDVTVKPGAVTAVGRDPFKKADIKQTANNASTTRAVLTPVTEILGISDPPSNASVKAISDTLKAANVPSETREKILKAVETGGPQQLQAVQAIVDADKSLNAHPAVVAKINAATGQKHYEQLAADHTMLTNALNDISAKRQADARFIKGQQTTVLLTATVVGDPRVSAKRIVEFKGISKRLSGRYYITKAHHKVSASEYTMELTMRTDGSHGRPANNTKSDGTLNTKPVTDANELVKKVDPRTGVTRYTRGDSNKPGET